MLEQRRNTILSLIRAYGRLPVSQLAQTLEVSEVTVRSDLAALSERGLIQRTRGGARLPLPGVAETSLEQSQRQYGEEKKRIGCAAAGLVQDGETIFLDVGSTTTALAHCLSPALRDVTVVTPGLNIALALENRPTLRVIVTGGTLRPLQHSLVSPYATHVLEQIQADWLFLGCNGVAAQPGVTNANHEEAEVKRVMVSRARRVVVVADHSKLGLVSPALIAPAQRVDILITSETRAIPADLRDAIPDIRVA
ncbi:transcriptional regulator, DeoR family [Deinococcus reticulitermitis]|uniref:Transcriptional regulator, DeoR family n=1 Tax=Deinococcus reticulitermitis TaxID=856736 RepID=A0A1H7AIY4_9DEIO|nr:DeoR/GlpR family DNA-binding transcription regulator [Deinococcus reticulitermitis]SEJ65288.1 transcriptional regulator, DeoR family [Deinococcus reticulitermitis]